MNPRRPITTLLLAVFLTASASAQTLWYSDFSSTTGLTLNAAEVTNGAILLAANQQNKSGSFFTSSQYNVSGFSAVFSFQISSPGGTSDGISAGADGLTFVVQRTGATALGGNGEGMGYGPRGGTAGIGNSVAVEFDTFKNSWDPDSNHIGLDTNGSLTSLSTAFVSSAFDDSTKWTAWVDYNATSNLFEVRLSSNGIRPTSANLSYTIDLASTIGGSSAFIGFTGATGSAYGTHEVLGFAFSDVYVPGGISMVPEPSTWALLLSGLGMVGLAAYRRIRR